MKSYLIIDANSEVSFAPNDQPLEDPTKSEDQLIVEEETAILATRRNYAFLHLYVLVLFERHKQLVP